MVRRFLCDESGATAIEYGLIGMLIAVAIMGGASSFANALNKLFNNNAERLQTALPDG
jgi:pilus assembly protein Flp/PilA